MRRFWLNVHCYVGLTAGAFLVVIGLTGSILAFQGDYDRWLHASFWRVQPQATRLSEQDLLDRVEHRFAVRAQQIDCYDDRTSQVFVLTDGRTVFVNPYNGAVLGVRAAASAVDEFVALIEELHVLLLSGNTGEWIVDVSAATLLVLLPTGFYLWWDKKRLAIKWGASWRRIIWDLHNVTGFYAFVLIFLLAVTGFFLAFETSLYWIVRSQPWNPGSLPRSALIDEARSIPTPKLDALMRTADRALPAAKTYEVDLPMTSTSSVRVLKRGPGLAGHSTVYLDRYNGRILRVDDLGELPRAYRAHFINQAIHEGTIIGLPSKVLMSLASLALIVSVVTGCIMWWKRLVT